MSDHPLDLSDKRVVITGGSSGIGLGIAEALVKAGASVCIWGRNPQKLALAEERLKSLVGERLSAGINQVVTCVGVNVAARSDVLRAMERTLERLGRIDACFACAGELQGTAFEDCTPAGLEGMLDNMRGVFWTFQETVKHLRRVNSPGALIAVGSAPRYPTHYAMSKYAITGLVRALASELAMLRISVNCIQPGWIDTPMSEVAVQTPYFTRVTLPTIPARRWGTPDDFAGIAIWLASNPTYTTGQVISVDGGKGF